MFRNFAAVIVLVVSVQAAHGFELKSPDFGPGKPFSEQFLFKGLGCTGSNISPELSWSNPPAGTKSFALMVHDPDAPTGGAGIWHWVVLNIPADARSIAQGAGTGEGAKLPSGSRQIANDYFGFTGTPGWGGPCPPKGQKAHNYVFTLYALGVDKIELPPTATASHAGFMINRAPLGKAVLIGTFGRE
jgi:hypothetical protein